MLPLGRIGIFEMLCWLEQEEGLFANEESRSWYDYMYKFISCSIKELKTIDVVTAESQPLSFYMYVPFSILICDTEKMCVEVYLILMSVIIRFCQQ